MTRGARVAATIGALAACALVLLLLRSGERERDARATAARPAPAPARLSAADVEAELAAREALAASDPTRASAPAAPEPQAAAALTIRTRLLDREWRPLAGARLAWVEREVSGALTVHREVRADASGAAWLVLERDELEGAAELVLRASAPAHLSLQRTVDPAHASSAMLSLGEWILPPGGDVAGRVVDAQGAAVAGAMVVLSAELGDASEEERARARLWPIVLDIGVPELVPLAVTDADGRFVLDGVPGGRFDVVAASLGEPPRLPARVERVLVQPGETSDAGELVLADAPEEELVRGVVLDGNDVPLAGAYVSLSSEHEAHPARTQATAAGRFALPAPRDTEFRVHALDPAGRWLPAETAGARAGGPELVLRLDQPAPPRAAPPPPDPEPRAQTPSGPARLSGRFTLGGEPAHGWSVQAGGRPLDHEGAFVLDGLPSGRSHVGLLKRGGSTVVRTHTEPVELVPGDNEWERDLAVGTLALENLPRAEPSPDIPEMDWPEYALLWKDGASSWMALFQETADGGVELAEVPAGRLELRYRGTGAPRDSYTSWPLVAEIELAAGERLVVTLP